MTVSTCGFIDGVTRCIPCQPLASTNFHISVTYDVSQVTATIDIANGTNGEFTGIIIICSFSLIQQYSSYRICMLTIEVSMFIYKALIHFAISHVDINVRITHDLSLITSTEDIVNTGSRDDIDTWVFLGISGEQFLDRCILCCVWCKRAICSNLRSNLLTSRFIISCKTKLCQVILHITLVQCYILFILFLRKRNTLRNSTNTFVGDVLSNIATITILHITIDRVGGQITTEIQFTDMNRFATIFFNINGDGTCDSSRGVVSTEHTLKRRTVGDGEGDV